MLPASGQGLCDSVGGASSPAPSHGADGEFLHYFRVVSSFSVMYLFARLCCFGAVGSSLYTSKVAHNGHTHMHVFSVDRMSHHRSDYDVTKMQVVPKETLLDPLDLRDRIDKSSLKQTMCRQYSMMRKRMINCMEPATPIEPKHRSGCLPWYEKEAWSVAPHHTHSSVSSFVSARGMITIAPC